MLKLTTHHKELLWNLNILLFLILLHVDLEI